MRKAFFCTLGVVSELAATARGILSPYLDDWDAIMAEIGCEEGPLVCGVDENGAGGEICDEGYACFRSSIGVELCDNVYPAQCSRECPEGTVLSPLRYCTCISFQERYQMFCAGAGEGGGGNRQTGEEEIDPVDPETAAYRLSFAQLYPFAIVDFHVSNQRAQGNGHLLNKEENTVTEDAPTHYYAEPEECDDPCAELRARVAELE